MANPWAVLFARIMAAIPPIPASGTAMGAFQRAGTTQSAGPSTPHMTTRTPPATGRTRKRQRL